MSYKVAVVVPAYNEAKTLRRTLQALRAQHYAHPWHLVVVDNGSTDDTRRIAEAFTSEFPYKMTVLSEQVKGTGAACRTGFEYAIAEGAEVVGRTDADSVPDEDWLARGAECFAAPHTQLVGGLSLPCKDGYYRFGDRVWVRIGEWPMRLLVAVSRAIKRPSHIVAYKFAQGNNMFVRAVAYRRVGGFRPISIGDDDEDICLSVRIIHRYGLLSVRRNTKVRVYISMRRMRTYGWARTIMHHTIGNHVLRVRQTKDIR